MGWANPEIFGAYTEFADTFADSGVLKAWLDEEKKSPRYKRMDRLWQSRFKRRTQVYSDWDDVVLPDKL